MPDISSAARPQPIVLIMNDLMFQSRIDEVARRLALPVRSARSMERLERHLASGVQPALVIVDLECDTLDPVAAIERLRRAPWGEELSIVGYAGHTNADAIRAGRAAGATTVLARSAFAAQLPALLERAGGAGTARGESGEE